MNWRHERLLFLLTIVSTTVVILASKLLNQGGWPEIFKSLWNGIAPGLLVSLSTYLLITFLRSDSGKERQASSVEKLRIKVGPQEELYEELIARLQGDNMVPDQIILIQHSGFVLMNGIIEKLMRLKTDIILYQQSNEIVNDILLEGKNSEYKNFEARCTYLPDELHEREPKQQSEAYKFKANLIIKQFNSPSSVRAILIENQALIVSWYIYELSDQAIKISGVENPGILVYSDNPYFEALSKRVKSYRENLDMQCEDIGHRYKDSNRIKIHKVKI